ncbi:MAG: DNA repair protein RecO, partial [Planctomycetales bacterium]
LFTRDFGKIGVMAKGARRNKNAFDSALDLLSVCRIVFIRKSSDALDLLTEAKLERRFRGGERGLPNLYAGYYVAELLREFTDEDDPHPELFDAAEHALQELCAEQSAASTVIRFELTALRLLGHAPSLHYCAETGEPVELEGKVPFGVHAGGVLGPNGRGRRAQWMMVDASVLQLMDAFLREDESWRQAAVDRKMLGELRKVVNPYLYHLLGRKPRMHDYLAWFSK